MRSAFVTGIPMAVAIINYNTRDLLRVCLAAAQAENPREIVVVDNASGDGSAEMVRAEFPDIKLLSNPVNVGYGAAANLAVAACQAPYILLLNSDTRVQRASLQALTAYLEEHPRAAIVGPRLVDGDGELKPSCYPFPTPLHFFLQQSGLGLLIDYIPLLRDGYLRTWPHHEARQVPWILGAALAIRRATFEAVGGFDEGFFLYFEEVDLCYRLAARGWQVHFAPVAEVVHVGGASTRQQNAEAMRYLFLSAARFYHKHYSRSYQLQLQLVTAILMMVKHVNSTLELRRTTDPVRRERLVADLQVWQWIAQNISNVPCTPTNAST